MYFSAVFKFEIAVLDQLQREKKKKYLGGQLYHHLTSCLSEYESFFPTCFYKAKGG